MLQCPTISASSGATSWWCGDTTVVNPCDEDGTNSNPTKAQIFSLPWNGLSPQAIMPWPSQNFTGCAISLNNQYSVERQIENATEHDSCSNGGTGSTTTTPTTETVEKNCPNGAKIGEGVAIGVLALIAIAMAGWALYERKQKNRLLAGAGTQKHEETQQYQQAPPPPQQQQHRPYYDTPKGYSTLAPGYQSPHGPTVSEIDSSGHEGGRHEMQS